WYKMMIRLSGSQWSRALQTIPARSFRTEVLHSVAVTSRLLSRRQCLDELVHEFDAVVILLNSYSFILAVCANIVDVDKNSRDTIGRYTGIAEISSVSRTCFHDRDHGNPGPQICSRLFSCSHDFGIERRWGTQQRLSPNRHRDMVIGQDLF